jgi:hypothetical protein
MRFVPLPLLVAVSVSCASTVVSARGDGGAAVDAPAAPDVRTADAVDGCACLPWSARLNAGGGLLGVGVEVVFGACGEVRVESDFPPGTMRSCAAVFAPCAGGPTRLEDVGRVLAESGVAALPPNTQRYLGSADFPDLPSTTLTINGRSVQFSMDCTRNDQPTCAPVPPEVHRAVDLLTEIANTILGSPSCHRGG